MRWVLALAIAGSVGVLNRSQESSGKQIVRPDFSGTWTLLPTSAAAIEGRGNSTDGQLHLGTVPFKLVVSQEEDKLRVEEHRQIHAPLNGLEYGLTGQPAKSQFVLASPRNAVPSEVTSKWVESKLISNIDVFVPGEKEPRRFVETMSISTDGILSVRIQRVGSLDSRTLSYRKAR